MNDHSFAPPARRFHAVPACKPLALAVALALAAPQAVFGGPLPAAEHDMSGIASVVRTNDTTMVITQNAHAAIINWGDFTVGAGASVTFRQPNNGVVLNRVDASAGSSLIDGSLSANGRVFIVNERGVVFGAGSSVSVGGLVASTLNIADADFLNGHYVFSSNGEQGHVTNMGNLSATGTLDDVSGKAIPGTVALLGATVSNFGTVSASLGTVALAAGRDVTLDFGGDGLTSVVVSAANFHTMVENGGAIVTDGGTVVMSAKSAAGAIASVVRQTGDGTIGASALVEKNGKLYLDAGTGGIVDIAGTLSTRANTTPGDISIVGKTIQILDGALIDARSTAGTGGNVTISASGGTEAPGAGAIMLDPLGSILANAVQRGNGGNILFTSDGVATVNGSASAKGGAAGGNGGTVTTSAPVLVTDSFRADASAAFATNNPGTWIANAATVDIRGTLATSIGRALNTNTSVRVSNLLYPTADNQNITIGQNVLKSENGLSSLTVNANANIIVANNIGIRATNGALNIALNSGLTGNGSVVMNDGSALLSNGGNIVLSGRGSRTVYAEGDALPLDGVLLNHAILDTRLGQDDRNMGGDVTIMGLGSTTTNPNGSATAGIRLVDATLKSGTGNIDLVGTGGLQTTASGGTGGNGVDISLAAAGSGIASTSGNISLAGHEGQAWSTSPPGTGIARGTGTSIALAEGMRIVSTDGAVSISGNAYGPGGAGGAGGYGTAIDGGFGSISAGGALALTGLANGTGAVGLLVRDVDLATTKGGTLTLLGRSATTTGAELRDVRVSTPSPNGKDGNVVIAGESEGAATGLSLYAARIGGAGMDGAVSISANNHASGGVDTPPMITVIPGLPDVPDTLTSITTSNVINFRPGGVSTGGAMTEAYQVPISVGQGSGFQVSLPDFHIGSASDARVVIGSSGQTGAITYAALDPLRGSLTLQNDGAGSAGITLAAPLGATGTVTLSSGGGVAGAAAITAASLLLHGSQPTSNFQLTNTGNTVGTFAAVFDTPRSTADARFGSVNFVNSGVLTLGSLSGDSYSAANGAGTTTTADTAVAGNLLVRTSGALALNQNVATANGIVKLVTGDVFTNAAGKTLVAGGDGGWQVYADTWVGETRGGLTGSLPHPNLYNCAYGATCSASLSGNGFIYRAQPSVTLMGDAQARTYGDANPALTYTVDGLINGDTAATALAGSYATLATSASNVGNYGITGTFTSPQGYLVQALPGSLAINRAPLRIVAADQGKVYGAADPLLAASYSGLKGDDTSAVVSGLRLSTMTGAAATAGTHAITASDATAQNYTIAYLSGTLTVSKAMLTVSADNQAKQYGAADPALSASASGLQYADTTAVLSSLQLNTARGAAATAGTHAITASDATAQNYTIAYQPGTLTVSKALLTISADDKNKQYGAADPVLTATVTGLKYADTAAVVSGLVLTAPQGAAATAGTHAITGTNASAGNYVVQYVPGLLTVSPAVLSYDAAPTTQFAGAPALPIAGGVSGFAYGDTAATATTGMLAFSSTATLASAAGIYPVQGSGLTAVNYIFVQAPRNASALVVQANPVVVLPTIVKDVTFETSNVYTKNVGTPRVCVATGSFTAAGGGDSDDPLAMEWSRVKVSPNLSNCLSMGQRNSCQDF